MSNEKITLPLEGMTCASCAMTIENALKKVDGVVEANVNFPAEKVTVEYDTEKTNKENLVKAVGETGYSVGEEE